jgi:NADH/NAD ratio-sensing transcriptional regulator Rex
MGPGPTWLARRNLICNCGAKSLPRATLIAVPAGAAQKVVDDLVDAGVRIIFNYSEGLLDVPSDVTVHTSNPAVELLHAVYFHLA